MVVELSFKKVELQIRIIAYRPEKLSFKLGFNILSCDLHQMIDHFGQ
jgi:hypothetical protein